MNNTIILYLLQPEPGVFTFAHSPDQATFDTPVYIVSHGAGAVGTIICKSVQDLMIHTNELVKHCADESFAPIKIYSPHSKSMMLRLLTYIRYYMPAVKTVGVSDLLGVDIVECLNAPAILSLEERRTFSPSSISKIMGIKNPETMEEVLKTVCDLFTNPEWPRR